MARKSIPTKPAAIRPTTRRVRTTEYIDEPPEPEFDVEIPDEEEETLRSITAQFGGQDIECKVYKVTANGKSYCYSDGPNVSEETIRSNPYGGPGRYVVHVMLGGELRRSFPVSIEPPQISAPAAGASATDNAILRALERLEQRLAAPQQSEPMSAVLNAAVGLITSQQSQPRETPLDQVMKMAEFIVQMRGGGEGDESLKGILSGIAREVAPTFVPLLMNRQKPPLEGGDVGVIQDRMLREGLSVLKKKCIVGADPNLYLALILDNADDEKYSKLVSLAAQEEFSFFVQLDPEIGRPPYFAFFKFIYDGLRSAVESADKVERDSGGSERDSGDAGPNVSAGQRRGKSK